MMVAVQDFAESLKGAYGGLKAFGLGVNRAEGREGDSLPEPDN
ncbi:hypothetical protein TC41_1310 [Alicyclobacillus acidocaldarius subsp. acidocaldarius Tc-4-1]|uniref:Uncharacterized protein n=1 Tax=Alicyclobacillus acidocaldarius (strain Tc-4-1) TaxID=1048834 RepID=F8IHV9_ALIAT|nr:hypothetical protein TC41_1310 [Alicyclobacillus acidocaldarius subsp. acidocaldarius Tc-4-1]